MWQCLGFHTYPASSPSVRLIKSVLPSYVDEVVGKGQFCELLIYFLRRHSEEENNLLFTQFYQQWNYGLTLPQ